MKIFITLFVCFIMSLPVGKIYAQNYVGIILNGYEKDCEVSHKGRVYQCVERKQLYIGDLIEKKPSVKMLKIKWAPFVNGDSKSKTTMEVVSSQPEKLKGNMYAGGLKQYINDFVKPAEHGAIHLVTRGPKQNVNPPLHATLMQGYPIKVSRQNEEIRSIEIFDKKGQKVYEKLIKGKDALSLNPAELGIEPLEKYTVYMNKPISKRKLSIVLTDNVTQDEIRKGLAGIDSENIAKPDKVIEKSTYLQLISDSYPDKIDFYWLSIQLLEENSSLFTKDQEEIVRGLKQRYNNHNKKTE